MEIRRIFLFVLKTVCNGSDRRNRRIVKEYFISEINIEKLYHLSNITIELDTTKRQHLLLTGKNGSGKTSLLLRLVRYLKELKDGHLIRLTGTWPEWEENAKRKMEHASSENERFKAEQDYRHQTGRPGAF